MGGLEAAKIPPQCCEQRAHPGEGGGRGGTRLCGMLSGQRRREGFERKPGNILASLFCCKLGAGLVHGTGSSLPLPARHVVGLEGGALFLM